MSNGEEQVQESNFDECKNILLNIKIFTIHTSPL